MRIVAAMSGGVDSAVAAARMIDAGHEVVGVHLALAQRADVLRESARGCCTIEDAGDARRVADRLGIPFYVWDFAERFRADVVEDFAREYAAGRTPNPCLRCNERIKFAALLDKALALGFDAVATGHYARIVERPTTLGQPGDSGQRARLDLGGAGVVRRELHRAVDVAKDQSYVLGVLDDAQLARSFFPLGDSAKTEVRAEAARRGFTVAAKPDSHDICFIPDGDTQGWLTNRFGAQSGEIRDERGAVVGSHSGAYGFTIGQRKGLHLRRPAADGRPRYVRSVDTETNTVVVAPAELLGVREIVADHVRWCGPPLTEQSQRRGPLRLGAQLRAHAPEVPVWVEVAHADADANPSDAAGPASPATTLTVRLDEPVRGVAPGQSVVLYDGTRVVGSGTISRTG
ncbi:MAG: tRNA 2-thiouridine(34) synthase MnmA [Actinomycetales bacterium]|nr:MAG: tRNA 2-thiouridine(34) synthase MnmA [Actinomycetales bacterium]